MIKGIYHKKLKKDIGIKRYNHSLRVMDTSVQLANKYNISLKKASVAGLLHDCGKLHQSINLLKLADDFGIILDNVSKNNKDLIHSHLGAVLAKKKYKISDKDVLNAIRYHTTGRKNMSQLEKIIYIADIIEPNRDFKGIKKIRELAYIDLDKCMLYAMEQSLKFIIDNGKLIHLDSVKARNHLLIEKNME